MSAYIVEMDRKAKKRSPDDKEEEQSAKFRPTDEKSSNGSSETDGEICTSSDDPNSDQGKNGMSKGLESPLRTFDKAHRTQAEIAARERDMMDVKRISREERIERTRPRTRSRSATPSPPRSCMIQVGRFTDIVHKKQLSEIYAPFGRIKYIDFRKEKEHNADWSTYAVIEFETPEAAELAVECMRTGFIAGQQVTTALTLMPWLRPPSPRRSAMFMGQYSRPSGSRLRVRNRTPGRGSFDEVKYHLDTGSDVDAGPDPGLHLALRRGATSIALLLLQAGAEYEVRDSRGDFPIHIACSLGLLDIVHTLCALGCSVEVTSANGLFPLHLAAKYGHIQIVRCLCTSGCNIDVKNADNIRADITALKYGHNNIAELIDRLRATGNRDLFARQLVPTSKPAIRLSLRLLGNCAAGKTALFKSLGAGLFSALFRRSSSLQSNKSRPSSPCNTQIEMDLTSRQNSLNFESSGIHNCTNGISVQNVDISNVGVVTVWEFSGQENYFPTYHNFLYPNANSLTAILFSLDEPASVQVNQVAFWINFLLARQQADLPSFEYGKIMLIATHVDVTRSVKNQQGEWISSDAQKTTESICKMFAHVSNLSKDTIVMDCNVPASYAFKQLKALMCTIKQDCIRGSMLDNFIKQGTQAGYDLLTTPWRKLTIGSWTGLLEATLAWFAILQKQYEQLPVLSRKSFSQLLRAQVNVLASDDHIYELLQQLHAMGEVHCIQNLVVLNVHWLGSNLIGELFSSRFLEQARVTGVYTVEDFQARFNQCDALAVLDLLEALDLCVLCEIDDDVEYEFPIYNLTETLAGLWDPDDPRYPNIETCYGGVRFRTASNVVHMFSAVFSYIQVEMRKLALEYSDNEIDLYQWHQGSKFCTISLETLVTLNDASDGNEYIEAKIRGPKQSSKHCFYFFEQIITTILQAITNVCPGLLIERHTLSNRQLMNHDANVQEYDPQVITSAMLDAESVLDVTFRNHETETSESLLELVLFDNIDLICNIQWGCALKVIELPAPVKLKLCGMLDPPESHGRDWCLLALRLGLSQERIAALDSQHTSCTMRLLSIADCTIGALVASLYEIDRKDAATAVLQLSPIHKITAQ